MIYITGDTHGYYDEFMSRIAPLKLTKDDIIIVTGDFGFVWGDPLHNVMLKNLSKMEFNIAFVDGNHENFSFLYMHPEEEWCGGRVHRIEQNIFHLMRGEIFNIQGSTFFTFGGAHSTDKYMRRKNISWWEQELPNSDEYRNANKNLKRVGYKVDYVLTHTIPDRFIYELGHAPDAHDRELTGYLAYLYDKLEFKKWFAGHWHVNQSFDEGKMSILFEDVMTHTDFSCL